MRKGQGLPRLADRMWKQAAQMGFVHVQIYHQVFQTSMSVLITSENKCVATVSVSTEQDKDLKL